MTGTNVPADSPPLPATDPAIPDDLRIARWLAVSPELAPARTAGEAADEMGAILAEWHQAGGYLPAVFIAANDGRCYAVGVEVVIRPATEEEVRDAEAQEQNEGEGVQRNGTREANATA